MRIYVRLLTPRQRAQAIREGHAPCCNIAHGENPPEVEFDRNPAALDALMRRGWCVCGSCYQRYWGNGRRPRVVVLQGRRVQSIMDALIGGGRGRG